jgi:hypothetical protein
MAPDSDSDADSDDRDSSASGSNQRSSVVRGDTYHVTARNMAFGDQYPQAQRAATGVDGPILFMLLLAVAALAVLFFVDDPGYVDDALPAIALAVTALGITARTDSIGRGNSHQYERTIGTRSNVRERRLTRARVDSAQEDLLDIARSVADGSIDARQLNIENRQMGRR